MTLPPTHPHAGIPRADRSSPRRSGRVMTRAIWAPGRMTRCDRQRADGSLAGLYARLLAGCQEVNWSGDPDKNGPPGWVYDAASDEPISVQESLVSTDGQPGDPRASLPAAIEAVAGGGDLETILDGVLRVASNALRPTIGAICISDPDRPGLQVVASHGMDASAISRLADEVADPAHPFTAAALTRVSTFDREAAAPGRVLVRGGVSAARRVESWRGRPARVDRAGLADAAGPRRCRARDAGRDRVAGWRWRSTGPGWRRPPRSDPNGSSGWRTRIR